MSVFKDKVLLITGGTGSFGNAVLRRFGTSEYGKSKKAGEELMFEYGKETGAKVLVYRFPHLFSKWCRPNYNSAIATRNQH